MGMSVGVLFIAHGRDKMPNLVFDSDAPTGCVLASLSDSKEVSLVREKENDFLKVYETLGKGIERLIIEAPTGSGKSRKCPNVIIKYMRSAGYQKPLLVLSSATIDVVGMQESCEYPSMYRLRKEA